MQPRWQQCRQQGLGGSCSYSFNVLDVTLQLQPQLSLVIVEMLALAPDSEMLSVGLRALSKPVSALAPLFMYSQDAAAVITAAVGVGRLFQPLVLLVAPALLHAAASSAGTSVSLVEAQAEAESLYNQLMVHVLSARQGE